MYNKVDFAKAKNKDEAEDILGYLGLGEWYREKVDNKVIKVMKDKEFITELLKVNRLKEVFHTIGSIDKDHNGYVTRNEMDDILKLYNQNLK